MTTETLSTDEILKKFSDPDLAAHAYLDLSFQKYNPMTQQAELHSQSSQLLSQLDHATEELTWNLETIMNELKKSGPRLTYQIELLRTGVSGLVSDIEEIASPQIETIKKTREVDTEQDQTVARLQQLETVRKKMCQVETVLKEAREFDEEVLTKEVSRLIDEGDMESALQKVEHAAELIQVWKGTSIYTGRAKFVAQLRKKIETALGQKDSTNLSRQQKNDRPSRSSNSPAVSRPGTPSGSKKSNENEGSYYGLLGQLQRKIGY
ncbi:uncharacterized protein SAPINGB_P004582 [Magnusiomyces paraingens]|uniref:Conserved oligomeric Golgi complex subunit 7 n=1 Tax=Magnusiomyces paraingens TaxID=2606893 RepID=A0A5E8BXQ4_9ASCO|nr:uncharacterized protein SAPINGB_P004582 [Saprochaete ingens]VVT55409.1 unnamed protein product [Saprochaete ingens]